MEYFYTITLHLMSMNFLRNKIKKFLTSLQISLTSLRAFFPNNFKFSLCVACVENNFLLIRRLLSESKQRMKNF